MCQPNYLNIYQTDLHQICRVRRTIAVEERCKLVFDHPSSDIAVATNFADQIQAQSTQ